jgi:hypothetical protein
MLLRKLGFLGALMTLLIGHYWGQNVFDQPLILAVGFLRVAGVLADLALLVAVAIVAGGLGRAIGRRTAWESVTLGERVAFEGALGLGVMGLGALALGLVGLYARLPLWGGVTLAGVLCAGACLAWSRDLVRVGGRALRPVGAWERLALGFSAGAFFLALWVAFAPPFKWDGLAYHLVAPQRYLAEGRITGYADNHFMGFPQTMEVLFGLGMAWGRDTFGAVLHAYVGGLALLAVAGVVRRHTSRTVGYTAVLLLMSSYNVWRLYGEPYVDLAVMLYGALGTIAVLAWRETGKAQWLLWAGAMGGFALSVKYTGGIICVAMAAVVAVRAPRALPANMARLAGIAVLCYALWGLKGALLYGNPFFPYGIGGLGWDSFRTAGFNQLEDGMLYTDLAPQLLALPLAATLFGVDKGSPYVFKAGAWVLSLPFFLPFVWGQMSALTRRVAGDALIMAGVFWGVWVVMSATSGIGAQPRLHLGAFPTAVFLGALVWQGVLSWRKRPLNMGFLLGALFAFTLITTAFNMLRHVDGMGVFPYWAGRVERDEYLLRVGGTHTNAMFALRDLPDGAHVLLMWEPMSYYCPSHVRCDGDVMLDHWAHDLWQYGEPSAVFEAWRSAGVDYVLVAGLPKGVNVGFDFWRNIKPRNAPVYDLFPPALDAHMAQVWTDNTVYGLYTWQDAD